MEWTTDTLKEYFESKMQEKDKAINIALAAAKEAVTVAENNSEKWRNNANEWRAAMDDREKTFLTKAEFITYKEATEKVLIQAKEHRDEGKGKWEGIREAIAWILAAIAIVAFAIKYL